MFKCELGPTIRRTLFVLALVSARQATAAGVPGSSRAPAEVTLTVLEDRVQSWREPLPDRELRGLRLLFDTPIPAGPTLGVERWIVRSNHRLDPFDALVMTGRALAVAREHHLPYGFFCATLLQESGFDPRALSPSGAVGIGQFTLATAADEGVDPFDWEDSIRGSGRLIGRYVAAYDGVYGDPYAVSLAAYNAGPGTVAFYHGVPPYAETREYIADIYDRWARILRDAAGPPVRHRKRRRR